ncbi:MAG: hypothetical protein OEW19_15680 [Acidobacteriota bacterium]|nr:hypothetical protein [Acidobacteriota bacterium]
MRLVLTVLLCLFAPSSSWAWGFEAHRVIADRFIERLPPTLRPLFEARRAVIVERSIDPDLWRNAGFETEPPNHFLDIDHEAFGPYPFDGLPRSYDAAVQKFGRAFLQDQGLLPWRVAEFYGSMQRAFESLTRPTPPTYALDNLVYYAAILSHYVSDGHVPLHAVVNYDGQLTNQHGVHARWESELFERNRSSLVVTPAAPRPVTDPRSFMFDVLLASNRMSAQVLDADRAAAEGRDFYDDGYFDAFAKQALPGLEQRLNASITAVASVIVGAWEQAGRPEVPTALPRTPRRVRRP